MSGSRRWRVYGPLRQLFRKFGCDGGLDAQRPNQFCEIVRITGGLHGGVRAREAAADVEALGDVGVVVAREKFFQVARLAFREMRVDHPLSPEARAIRVAREHGFTGEERAEYG